MTDSVATAVDDHSDDNLWGHPKGLYVCFTTELWERFSFYGMKYLLLLYLTKYHLFSDGDGAGRAWLLCRPRLCVAADRRPDR